MNLLLLNYQVCIWIDDIWLGKSFFKFTKSFYKNLESSSKQIYSGIGENNILNIYIPISNKVSGANIIVLCHNALHYFSCNNQQHKRNNKEHTTPLHTSFHQLQEKLWVARMLFLDPFSYFLSGFRRKGALWLHECQYVILSVGKRVFSKMAHRIFLKLLMKLGCLKGKKLMKPYFWEKSLFGDYALKHPENKGFWIFQKISPLVCRFLGFKSCIIMTFMILLKPYVWEKSSSQVKCKNVLSQSDCRIFNL